MDKSGRTIADFGEQWTEYRSNEGYYASQELFLDIAGAFIDSDDVAGARVADIGSGTGRIVNMLLDLGAAHATAYEPSAAFEVLKENVTDQSRTTLLNIPGDQISAAEEFDLVFSIGVLHHIPDPDPVVSAAFRALKPDARLLVWLYGYEGNRLYLAIVNPLRFVTTRLPHRILSLLVRIIDVPLLVYMALARYLPVPMAKYMNGHMSRLSGEVRRLTIYDQLNPAHAKYYRQREAIELLTRNGFVDVKTYHRHGYSWTVAGRKPAVAL